MEIKPLLKLYFDYTDPINGTYYLVVVDIYTQNGQKYTNIKKKHNNNFLKNYSQNSKSLKRY